MGLEGKLTATHAGPELLAALKALNLPPYPHSTVDVSRWPAQAIDPPD